MPTVASEVQLHSGTVSWMSRRLAEGGGAASGKNGPAGDGRLMDGSWAAKLRTDGWKWWIMLVNKLQKDLEDRRAAKRGKKNHGIKIWETSSTPDCSEPQYEIQISGFDFSESK